MLMWVLGFLAAAGGVAALSGGDDAPSSTVYRGFTVRVAGNELGTWAFTVHRSPSDSAPVALGVGSSAELARSLAHEWIDANFPGGPSTVPVGYAPAGPELDGMREDGLTEAELADMDNGELDDVDGDDVALEPPAPPVPPGPVSTSVPPNYVVLHSAADLQSSRLMQAVEGEASAPKTVFVGMDPEWVRRPEAVQELRRLAIEWPQVRVRVFSFERTRELVGQPPSAPYMAYLAVAVDLSGQPGPVMTGATRDAELGRETLENLFALALGSVAADGGGDGLPATAILRELRKPGDPPSRKHIVLMLPRPGGGFSWQVWRGVREGEPIGTGTGDTSAKAFEAARHFVQWYRPGPTGGLRLG